MQKQVVTEVVVGDDIQVTVSYEFDNDLKGKKQFEEVVNGNITKYWIYVPKNVDNLPVKEWVNQNKIDWDKKRREKFELIAAKKLRMMRYAECIARGEEIVPTDKEISDALLLKEKENRQHKGVEELFAA